MKTILINESPDKSDSIVVRQAHYERIQPKNHTFIQSIAARPEPF